MTRPIVLHICLAFCSLLFLNFTMRCLAFPKMERRETGHTHAEKGPSERMSTDDLENSPITPKLTPWPEFSEEDPMTVSAGPSATPLKKVLSINQEALPTGAGLPWPSSPGLFTVTDPEVPAGDDMFSSSQPENMSPENRLSKAMPTIPISASASLHVVEKEEPFSSTTIQPTVEGTTKATQGVLTYVESQLLATESQEGVSLGHSPSSYMATKEMLTLSPKAEEFEADTDQRTTSFPSAEATADSEPGHLASDGEQHLQTTADDTQATATEHMLATSEPTLSVEQETHSMLGVLEGTVGVSTAVPPASVLSDEWDDTKLEHVSQIRTPQLTDDPETRVRMEPWQTAGVSQGWTEGGLPLMEATAEVALELSEGETHTGTTQGDEKLATLTHQSSFTPTSLTEGTKVSAVNLLQSARGFSDSTKEKSAMFLSETTVSTSQYEAEAFQPLGSALTGISTQEMTTNAKEPEATLAVVTQEQDATLQVTEYNGETTEGKESPSSVPDIAGATQLSRRWEPLATTVSTTAVPLSHEVTSAVEDLMDMVTEPGEEFTPVLGSPVTLPGIMEVPTVSPELLASERRTVPSISDTNTAASYGLDQLESEEGEEDEDEEDEDDEEEEEEDEEDEDEEDKDADSLDEPRGFTLPGFTSQEPGLEQGNLDPLEGATYQVPDAIEWEQQNQGLVRSWMEKLKDKAGYMSGMLVPVGVGIAGALFILGALYSIKVMNRRRRNGFKRHKRKQREFNSMQDRVMLLADSSEDEF